ncbi:MAG: DNA recombination protein RmuC [Methylotenera sp.]|jgi:DNA recombination protein RmuC|uniref:DNA recombination protein RmuC n=1 Tax=Methylotenera mobilis TaxID=359408 RepID=UPI00037C6B3C|nr:DNA recombination protein RmuC [Methylotenera mobilis]PPC94514.1 MAG: DNA recombination protein RmuC [Methylotenera sp.]
MVQIIILIISFVILLLLLLQMWRESKVDRNILILQQLEEKHRAMLLDFNDGLNKLGDRLSNATNETSERLRASVATELQATRDAMQTLQLAQNNSLSQTRETVLEKLHTTLAEQGKAEQELIQSTMRNATLQLTASIEALTKSVDGRLELIGGKVSERLDEGFKKTNQTFIDVMARLATIDEAQKKIDGLTTNVVSLQELLGDKRSRGAFGEVQLEALVRNVLPVNSFAMQHTFENGTRADCALFLPEPTGVVAVDSKFPLENYHRMLDNKLSDAEKLLAEKQFKLDVKKHVDDIATKYIISNVTSDGAVMFIPAEAVFAELHAYHADVIEYAMNKRVWVVSPTTLMAVLNTARAVLKDVETRKQVHVIKEELGKLSKDFGRFDLRMKKLADNIRQAHENAQDVHISSQKISQRFAQIERVELTKNTPDLLDIIDDKTD